MSVHVCRYILQLFLIFLKIHLWIYLFLAMLGLRCCVGLPLVAKGRGVGGLRRSCNSWASHCGWLLLLQRTGSRVWGLQQLWLGGLAAQWHVGSSRNKDQTHVPCAGRQILNHWATRGPPDTYLKVCK